MTRENDETERFVTIRKDGRIATLVLNRIDKRNAISEAMWQEIATQAEAIGQDASIRALIIRGVDETAFSAGADIAEFERVHASPEAAHRYRQVIDAAYDAIADLSIPTIALVQGICFGGGCALSLCCDFRYADPGASFCIPPAKLGLVYSLKETKRLADLVGPSKAKEMLMAAQVIDADEALRIGLVTRLFPRADLERETADFASRMAALSTATISAVKIMMGEVVEGAFEDTETTRRLVDGQFDSDDYIEGRRAFLEKRKPTFS